MQFKLGCLNRIKYFVGKIHERNAGLDPGLEADSTASKLVGVFQGAPMDFWVKLFPTCGFILA